MIYLKYREMVTKTNTMGIEIFVCLLSLLNSLYYKFRWRFEDDFRASESLNSIGDVMVYRYFKCTDSGIRTK